ncbi:Uncharacterised protein [Salmonella enterica subsp. enterica serovar Bovismorbificans]|nr:Uncharacterised protein [Salmonella enterica subsp. enterica serovar Bovismorbificans]CNU37011.1 Uncharacterised protein [Salmonella enterica subsp. enterica serovar Bovismorbificans]
MFHHRQVVRDKDIRQPHILLQIHHQVQHLGAHRHVERGDRFVGNHYVRIKHQTAGDSDTLTLAAGEHMRIAVVVLGFQPHLRHHRQRFFTTLRFTQAGIDQQRLFQNLPHFLAWVQGTVGVLKHNLNFLPPQFLRVRIVFEQILPLVIKLAAGWRFNHRQQATQCGFSTTGLPHYGQRFTAFEIKRHAIQRFYQPFRRKDPLLHRIVFFQVDSPQQRLLQGGLMRAHSVGLPASSSG